MQDAVMRVVMTDVKAYEKLLCIGRVLLLSKFDWPQNALGGMHSACLSLNLF
jgi:hypothetical protein